MDTSNEEVPSITPDEGPPNHKRRPRYGGAHPRSFGDRYKELAPQQFPEMHAHIRAQGRTPAGTHVPVLLNEVMESLNPRPGEIVADCTVGYGGHALAFLERLGPTGRLVGLDVDAQALARTQERLTAGVGAESGVNDAELGHRPFSLHRSHFAGLGKLMESLGLPGFDILFADLGVSSMQIDDPARGFSYKHDGPLDMRMDDRLPRSAADCLASLSEKELASALSDFADEPKHVIIARAIVRQRQEEPITRTSQLVALIFKATGVSRNQWRKISSGRDRTPPDASPASHAAGSPIPSALEPETASGLRPSKEKVLHPAARTFQALRMLVNDELGGLKQFLRIAPYCLRPGGRIGIISFHSGEDRAVKHAFRESLRAGIYQTISENFIRPSPEEVRANPRASSAKLRWACKG